VVFTLWLSMMAAEGSAWRPARRRTARRNASWTRCQMPCRRHGRQVVYVVCPGGYSRGRERQAQPVRKTEKSTLTSSRNGHERGRPRRAGAGYSGASSAHSASVTSQGYRMATDAGEHGMRRSLLYGVLLRYRLHLPGCRCIDTWMMGEGERGRSKGGQHGPSRCYGRRGGNSPTRSNNMCCTYTAPRSNA
jgi:hypothetical protein